MLPIGVRSEHAEKLRGSNRQCHNIRIKLFVIDAGFNTCCLVCLDIHEYFLQQRKCATKCGTDVSNLQPVNSVMCPFLEKWHCMFYMFLPFGPGIAPSSPLICIDVDAESHAHDPQLVLRNAQVALATPIWTLRAKETSSPQGERTGNFVDAINFRTWAMLQLRKRLLTQKTKSPKGSRKMISGYHSVYPARNGIVRLFRFDWNSGVANVWRPDESTGIKDSNELTQGEFEWLIVFESNNCYHK